MTQTTELTAIADALRQHDRFLVVTHENPDGDALGSLLATTLALRQVGKDAVMYLPGRTPLPSEYRFMPLEELLREPPELLRVLPELPEVLRELLRDPEALRDAVREREVPEVRRRERVRGDAARRR